MGTVIEDLYDHEGFGARLLPDGSFTGTWSKETARFEVCVAACGCGWQGEQAHPPTEEGYDSAIDEWERSHARPLLAENGSRWRGERHQERQAGDRQARP